MQRDLQQFVNEDMTELTCCMEASRRVQLD